MCSLTLSVSLATDASDETDATAETVTPAHSWEHSAASHDGLVGTNQLRWQGKMLTMARCLGSGKFASVYELVPNSHSEKASVQLVAKVTVLANLSPWARAQLKQEEEIWCVTHRRDFAVLRRVGHLTHASALALMV